MVSISNRLDLAAALLSAGVRSTVFSVDGERDLALCMEEVGGSWEIFYFERGGRSILGVFSSEASACEFMYDSVMSDPTSFI